MANIMEFTINFNFWFERKVKMYEVILLSFMRYKSILIWNSSLGIAYICLTRIICRFIYYKWIILDPPQRGCHHLLLNLIKFCLKHVWILVWISQTILCVIRTQVENVKGHNLSSELCAKIKFLFGLQCTFYNRIHYVL